MDLRQSKEIPYYRCHEHKKQIDLIYLQPNSQQTLACTKCVTQNQLDLDYLVEIEELFKMDNNENQMIYNLPLKLTQEQYSIIDNIMNEENENEDLIQQIKSEFDSFKENVLTSIENQRNNILIHAQIIQQQRQKVIKIYNQLINKSEIKNKIIEFESYPNKLHEYLKNLALIKEKQQYSDKSKILNSLHNLNDVKQVFDFDQLKYQLEKIQYQIESFRFIQTEQKNNDRDSRSNNDSIDIDIDENNNADHAIINNNDVDNIIRNNNVNNDNDMNNDSLLFQQYDLLSEELEINQVQYYDLLSNIQKDFPQQQTAFNQQLSIYSFQQLKEIKNIEQYEDLFFCVYDMQSEGNIDQFCDKLKHCSSAHSLSFLIRDYEKIQQGFMKEMAKSIKSCPKVNKLGLEFYSTFINDEGFRDLFELISSFENLEVVKLGFRCCKIGNYGAKQISIVLKSCQKLKQIQLYLKYNGITLEGIQYLAEGIQTCKELTSFYLDLINTKKLGVKAELYLRQALSQCKKLQNNQFDKIQKNN